MKFERVTEDIVREQLKRHGHTFSEQQTEIEPIRDLLRYASKKGSGGGWGWPEFIVPNYEQPVWLVVIECKADVKDHQKPVRDNSGCFQFGGQKTDAEKYAVEGVKHYMGFLALGFNVIGIAVSGDGTYHITDTFIQRMGEPTCEVLTAPNGDKLNTILSWNGYLKCVNHDPEYHRATQQELNKFAKDIHEFMYEHLGLAPNEKALILAGTVKALKRASFRENYSSYPIKELRDQWELAINLDINSYGFPEETRKKMSDIYHSIAISPQLNKGGSAKYPAGLLHELIRRLHKIAMPLMEEDEQNDSMGNLYGEFLKFTGGDKQEFGIVLTPRHATELAASLMNIRDDSKVLDICAGTGGFLVAAHAILKRFGSVSPEAINGVEEAPHMHALAAANLSFRDDRLVAGLLQGDCFDPKIIASVREKQCNIGFINPPYSDHLHHPLKFVKHMLDMLTPRGRGLALVPIGSAHIQAEHKDRAELLRHHTLEAVMTLPDQLFHGVGTNPCFMIFTAHVPHDVSVKTWFSMWKDDGFIINKGRIETDRWPNIREGWLDDFKNKVVQPGVSVLRKVGPNDTWLAEAYVEPDYSLLTEGDFTKRLKNLLTHRMLSSVIEMEKQDE